MATKADHQIRAVERVLTAATTAVVVTTAATVVRTAGIDGMRAMRRDYCAGAA